MSHCCVLYGAGCGLDVVMNGVFGSVLGPLFEMTFFSPHDLDLIKERMKDVW